MLFAEFRTIIYSNLSRIDLNTQTYILTSTKNKRTKILDPIGENMNEGRSKSMLKIAN